MNLVFISKKQTSIVCFFLRLCFKTNFNFIILFKLIITKTQWAFVLDFFASWPRTPTTEILKSYVMREIYNI